MRNQKRQLFVPGPPAFTKSVSFPSASRTRFRLPVSGPLKVRLHQARQCQARHLSLALKRGTAKGWSNREITSKSCLGTFQSLLSDLKVTFCAFSFCGSPFAGQWIFSGIRTRQTAASPHGIRVPVPDYIKTWNLSLLRRHWLLAA